MEKSKSTKPKKTTRAATPARPGDAGQASAAYQRIQSAAGALDPNQLATINIDIPVSVSIILGAMAKLTSVRETIVSELPKFDVKNLDHLQDYALGAWYAHLVALPQQSGPTAVAALDAEAIPLRENLLADAEALARRGLLDAEAVAHIRSGTGQVDRANDLVALSALFSANWSDVENKTAATDVEVARAGQLGPALLAALGVRRSGTSIDADEAAEMRVRCFTLFFDAYDQCRRAMIYLRWDEGDADAFAPSLYSGRGGRGTTSTTQSSPPEPPSPPPAEAPPPTNPTAPVAATSKRTS
jgi:hypothetical protein